MPDLGEYAGAVLGAYGVSILLLGLLIWGSVRSWRRAKADLEAVEQRLERENV